MNQRQGAVLAPKKEETIWPVLQSDPQLGGEGSGFPPRFYVATGQHNRMVLGIDLGSESIRVSALEEDRVSIVFGPTPASLGLNLMGHWTLSSPAQVSSSRSRPSCIGFVQSIRTKVGTDWCKNLAGESVDSEQLIQKLMYSVIQISRARSKKVLRDAVLTVPASYTSMERKLLKMAAEDNGLSVLQLINEPTAVALGYCVQKSQQDGNYLLFHMGAGTCAAMVYSLSNGIMEIKATSCDSTMGGKSFDDLLVNHLITKFSQILGRKPRLDEFGLRRVEAEAIELKHNFLLTNEAFYNIVDIEQKGGAGSVIATEETNSGNFLGSLRRSEYDELVEPLVEAAIEHIHSALKSSRLRPGDVEKMLVCGGGTLLPALYKALTEIDDLPVVERIEDDMMASSGAAIQASLVCQTVKQLVVWDLLTKPISLMIDPAGSLKTLIAANSPLPITAYVKLPIVDNTISARLVQGDVDDCKTYTDIVINNCPPCTNGTNEVELAVRVSQDGILSYSARHIGLDVSLLVNPMQDECRRYQGDLERLLDNCARDVAGLRAQRLARTLNVPLYFLPQSLRAMGFSPEQIVGGQAIELALRKIKVERRPKARRG